MAFLNEKTCLDGSSSQHLGGLPLIEDRPRRFTTFGDSPRTPCKTLFGLKPWPIGIEVD